MIIADENIFRRLIVALRLRRFAVLSILNLLMEWQTQKIATFTLKPPRIILTEDKDFVTLVFENKTRLTVVVFLRFLDKQKTKLIEKVFSFLQNQNLETLTGKYITLIPFKIGITNI